MAFNDEGAVEPAGILGRIVSRRHLLWGCAAFACGLGVASAPARAQTATPEAGTPTIPAALLAAYERTGATAEGWPLRVVLAAPAYLRAAGLEREPALVDAERALSVLTIRRHGGALTTGDDPFAIAVRLDGGETVSPAERRTLRDDGTERSDVFIFPTISPAVLDEDHLIEVVLPTNGDPTGVFQWITPIVAPVAPATPTSGPATSPTPTTVPATDFMETVIPSGDIKPC